MKAPQTENDFASITSRLLATKKGILAADESPASASKRFAAIGIECSEQTRRDYRELLFSAPAIEDYITGVILQDETIRQSSSTGTPLIEILTKNNIIPGIKVDTGLVELTNFAPETITEGLDGLSERLREYYSIGARFTKWRAAFAVDVASGIPSLAAIHANCNAMARYATLVQSAGMVAIVEPEILYQGSHSLRECKESLSIVLRILFELLAAYKVDLSGIILKSSMVLAGSEAQAQSTPLEVAKATLEVFIARVPVETAGIVFLSGGQEASQATSNLNAIAKHGAQPWPITFSFSRALQDAALQAWAGNMQNTKLAQSKFLAAAHANSLASIGKL